MKMVRWSEQNLAARSALLARPTRSANRDREQTVRDIVEQVRSQDDAALLALTSQFDGVQLSSITVSADEFAGAQKTIDPQLKQAMIDAKQRLTLWHQKTAITPFDIDTAPGVRCGRIVRPIERVGLYVPAGSAPLPSTALMLGVPAALAGCQQIVLCTPPNRDGLADPSVLVAAQLCGIENVYKIGGAQAIAAMAFGTATISACDKLFGPGNAWVTLAKQYVSALDGGPAIDMPAGPSEVLVIADSSAPVAHVAADLLSQAEHGPDSQVILISDSASLLEVLPAEIDRQLVQLPRAKTAGQALVHARLILVESLDTAFEISNVYGPEHLILALADAAKWIDQVRCAGSIFVGNFAPESLGDYCSGTNHVLPTGGAARAYSGVSLASFQCSISIQTVTREGLAAIGDCAVTLARAEGLEAHAQAVLRRQVAA